MSDRTAIEWTDASWNPVTGCTKVSPGCDHCYAETFAERFRGVPGHHFERGFDVTLRPERLDQPLRWRRPRRIFVNSMSDLFHDSIPDEYIADVFTVMARAAQHTFQVLTKRPGRMRSLLSSPRWTELLTRDPNTWPTDLDPERPLDNVWLGVSVEDQRWADIRIPALLATPAAVRFISAEPLLGPVDLHWCSGVDAIQQDWIGSPAGGTGAPHPLLDWVITGGESGPGARPMHPAWVRQIRDQCIAAGVAYLHKQNGEWSPERPVNWRDYRDDRRDTFRGDALVSDPDGARYLVTEPDMLLDPAMLTMYRVGKKAAGRELDGRTWDGYPAERVPA